MKDIIPAHGETPGRIDEAGRVGIEASGDGEHDGELSQRIDDVEDHDTDDAEGDDQCSWTLPSVSTVAGG